MRLDDQLAFILTIDKLKNVVRRTLLTDASRNENSSEHSWHTAIMAGLLAEYAAGPVDANRAMQMMLVHDVVEVDAGDTYAYDAAGNATKVARELAAADRIFGLLPPDQRDHFRALWDEFEEMRTPESRYANALDRAQAALLNFHSSASDRIISRNLRAKVRLLVRKTLRASCWVIVEAPWTLAPR